MCLASLPRETLIPSDSGSLDGVGLAPDACSGDAVDAVRRWIRGRGPFFVLVVWFVSIGFF